MRISDAFKQMTQAHNITYTWEPTYPLLGDIKSFRIFDLNDQHQYDLEIRDEMTKGHTFYTLSASISGNWSQNVKGKILITVVDTGNNIKIVYPDHKEEESDKEDQVLSQNGLLQIDYDEEEYLLVVLQVKRNLYLNDNPSLLKETKLKVIKSETLFLV